MPAEEHSGPFGQGEAERGQPRAVSKQERISGSGAAEQPVPGPSGTPARHGFCSLCQLIYSSVEQHIDSSRHKQAVRGTRLHVAPGSLMERFLQDVIQHHPHRYNDTRPTHADLPTLSSPLVPREELSDVCCTFEDDGDTVGTREEMLSSDDDSRHFIFVEDAGPSGLQNSSLQEGKTRTTIGAHPDSDSRSSSDRHRTVVSQIPQPDKRDSPTLGFLHRTSRNQATIPSPSVPPVPAGQCSSQGPVPGQQISMPLQLHRKAHRKTNRRRNRSGSASSSSAAMKSSNSKAGLSQQLEPRMSDVRPPVQSTSQVIHRGQAALSEHSDTIENVIEEVIEKYCYARSNDMFQGDEDSFHLSLRSITSPYFSDSGSSLEWDVPVQAVSEMAKPVTNDLGCLMEVHVNLNDQTYKSQLDTTLNLLHKGEEKRIVEAVRVREETDDEVLPALPHIPQSFVGKTLSQVMYEDDLKIEAMVQEFKEGRFRCYFETESLAKFGKSTDKRNVLKGSLTEEGWLNGNVIPLEDYPEVDHAFHGQLRKKAGHRTCRLASRCQVVKVSHSTQTTALSSPVVKRKVLGKASTSEVNCEPQQNLTGERTPDMKTRLCALKLPEVYSKIMSPLQPKTVVYVLSSPESGQGILKPVTIRKAGRKRKSSDNESALKYKYKKTPLKYYDPLTNRILKTPPKGVTIGKPKPLPHVRQLFRSLSPDINKEKQFVEQKEVRSSSKGRGGSLVEFCASTSGSCLESIGASELGSSVSSRRALFSHSSLSSSGRFLPESITPAASHTDSATRVLSLEPDEAIQTRRRASDGRHRQGGQVEYLKEKSLISAKGAAPSYRPRKVPARLMSRRGGVRPELPIKTCSMRQQSVSEDHKKGTGKGLVPKAKAKSSSQNRKVSQRITRKKSPRSKVSVRTSSRTTGVQKRSSVSLTRSSTRHPPAPLTPQKLRKRMKR